MDASRKKNGCLDPQAAHDLKWTLPAPKNPRNTGKDSHPLPPETPVGRPHFGPKGQHGKGK